MNVFALNVDYRSSGYNLADAGERAFHAKVSLSKVRSMARDCGLDDEQSEIVIGAWRGAREEKRERTEG
jgi:hypothetical protein